MIGVRVSINKDMFKMLKAMPFVLAKKTARRMVTKGTSIFATESAKNAPVGTDRTGKRATKNHLRDVIGMGKVRKYKTGQLVFRAAGPLWPDGAHGHLVEEGHKIKGPGGSSGGGFGGKTRPNRFAQRTWDQKIDEIWLAQVKIARKAVDKYFKSIPPKPKETL